MRGKRPPSPRPAPQRRITPAHAGKTRRRPRFAARCTDHPRACGENGVSPDGSRRPRGSPPRMRGKPRKASLRHILLRITPAHAGKTRSGRRRERCRTDHPRACGENIPLSAPRFSRYGSPPRMRGKQRHHGKPSQGSRITPAHAGKTKYRIHVIALSADHPRACGENTSEMAYFRG